MRKLITFFLFLWAVVLHAQQITPDEAAAIASEFLSSSSPQLTTAKRVGVKRAKAKSDAGEDLSRPYYVFNSDDNQGFVIVSGDKRTKKILGYSDTSNFDFDNLPPQLASMLEQYAKQIKSLPASATTDPSWNIPIRAASTSESKLLETANWGQWYPYNIYAPEINGVKCPSGCVATAMAIVMKYNNWPNQGRGKHKWYSNGTLLNYNFEDTRFDYSLMPDTYEDGEYNEKQAIEVAKLMQAAAAGVNMAYDTLGSGAMTCVVGHYMYEYFRYSPQCQYISAANFEEDVWLEMIYKQINANHPVIMSGTDEAAGHAFVCDGYSSEDYLHINWGWDGINNGFFSPFVLGGYKYGIGMVINLFNDGCEKEYARCWNDYGYLWATAGQGAGFNVSVENIEKDVPFSAIVGQITFPNDFSGIVCLAVVDKNDSIIEVNEEVGFRFEENQDWDHIGYTWVGHGPLSFKNVTFSTDIEPDMHIQAVARENEGEWKFILGTIEASSSIKVIQNKPYISHIEWNIHDPYHITDIEYQNNNEHSVLLGDDSPFNLKVRSGVAYVMVDGVYRCNGSDFTDGGFNFATTKDNYTIDIYANRYEDLLERTIELEQPGTLFAKIPKDDQPLIYSLTIKGSMNADDYAFITNKLYSLKHLDVRNTTVEASEYNRYNYLPQTAGHHNDAYDGIGYRVWEIESIILPNNLLGFEAYSMPHAGIEFLEIPKSLEKYEWSSISGYGGMKLDFLKVNNPTPVDIPDETGALDLVYDGIYRNNTILYVPAGSKEAYATSPSWRGYKDIRESNSDFIGKFMDFDGARYLILSDFSVISGIYEPHGETFVVPSSIEYNGKIYPVTGNCRNAQVSYLYLMNTQEFEFNHFYQNAITPYVSANYKCKKEENTVLWVPGGSSENYTQTGTNNINEMWEYKIDRQHKLLSVIPSYMCSISEIRINGEKAEQISENLYKFSDKNGLTVDIQFSTFGHEYVMCTNYSYKFNQNLPNTNLAKSVEQIDLNLYKKQMVTNEEFIIEAKILPEDATIKELNWTTSDESIAIVDAYGKVTAMGDGEATITATSADGSGVSASCQVTVLTPKLGDSNANGTVNIADAVNTANYAVGNEVENFCLAAADVNADGEVTMADASGTITIILAQPVQESRQRAYSLPATSSDEVDCLRVADYSAATGEAAIVGISLDNSINYVALQADIILPEGLTLQSVAGGIRAAGHALTTRQIDSRRVRVVLFDLGNSAFVDSRESLLELKVRVDSDNAGDIIIENIIASDASANEYRLVSTGGHNNTITKTDRVTSQTVQIEAANGSINVYHAAGSTVVVYGTNGRMLTRFVAENETEHYQTAPGIYIVSVGSRMVKVVVK